MATTTADCPDCGPGTALVAVPTVVERCETLCRACAHCGWRFTLDGITWPWAAAHRADVSPQALAVPPGAPARQLGYTLL